MMSVAPLSGAINGTYVGSSFGCYDHSDLPPPLIAVGIPFRHATAVGNGLDFPADAVFAEDGSA